MVTQAPVITKGAVPPPVQGGGRPMSPEELEQAKRERAERERVIAAVNFGAALQDLVVHARLEKNGPDAALRRLNSAQFPPDLFYRINPETLLRNTCHKLLKLEETLLRLLSLEETLLRPEQHDETRQRQQQGHQGWQRQQVQQGQQQPEEMGQQRQQQEQRSEETGQGRQESEETGQGRQEQKRQEQQEEQRPEEVGQPRQQGQQRPEETGQQRQQQRQQGQQRRQGASGGAGQTFGRASGAPPAPSAQIMIKQKVEQLITYARRNPHAELESYLSQHDGVDATICEWDALIVERIVDFPAVFAGYRTGKALSMTRWKIWEAKRWNSVDGNPYIDTWKEAFSKKRIGEIKRQVSSLGTVLDPQAVAVVTTSLGYWREALLTLTLNKESSKARGRARWRRMLQSIATFRESSKIQSTQPSEIEISPEHGQRLQSALDEQITSWLDLLTQRRPLESFPVVGIVTALTKKMAAAWWKKLMRYAIIIGVGLAVVLILGTLIAVGIMVYNDIKQMGNKPQLGRVVNKHRDGVRCDLHLYCRARPVAVRSEWRGGPEGDAPRRRPVGWLWHRGFHECVLAR